jgi:hypothetical protein
MNTQSILESIQTSALADWMRYTNAAMPVVEATHVLSAVLLFGTVLIVDLRLLGFADASRAFTRVSRETLPLSWLAFGVSVVTGSLMFTTSAQTYFGNTAFQLKALALFGAGLNMALFQCLRRRARRPGIGMGQGRAPHASQASCQCCYGRPWFCWAAGSGSRRDTTSPFRPASS